MSAGSEHGDAKAAISDIARRVGTAPPCHRVRQHRWQVMNRGMADPVVERTLDEVRSAADARTAIEAMAHGVRSNDERHLEVVQVMITAAAVERGPRGR